MMEIPAPLHTMTPGGYPVFAAADAENDQGSRRAASFAASLAIHAAVIAALAVLPRDWSLYVTPHPYDLVEEEFPRERFVLYYQPPELPPIAPAEAADDDAPLEPDVMAVQRMISVPEIPTLNQTRVYLPEAPPVSEEKVEAENVIVVNPEPEPEPVRRVAPKAFVAPAPRTVERAVIDSTAPMPEAVIQGPIVTPTTAALVDLPDAPPRPASVPELAKETATTAPAPTPAGTAIDPQAKASATVAVVTPSPAAGRMPVASAEADFRVGPPGARETSGKGLGSVDGAVTSVPNLAVSAAKPSPAASPEPSASAAANRGPIVAPTRTLLSVALRPGLRRLPTPVEQVFAKRDVYVYLIETRSEGRRGPDWTIWFAEVDSPPPGRPPLVRPPVPVTPISVNGLLATVKADGRTLHLRGVIRRSGEFETTPGVEDETKIRIAGALRATPFLPANRNGVATDVDVVVEVQGAR
jgi:hypothetical protein